MALARFGLPFLDDPVEGRVRPRMAVHGTLAALFDPTRASEADLLVRFDLDGEQLWLQVGDRALVTPDPDREPDLVVRGSSAALVAACRGTHELGEDPRLTISGSVEATAAFARLFRLLVRATA